MHIHPEPESKVNIEQSPKESVIELLYKNRRTKMSQYVFAGREGRQCIAETGKAPSGFWMTWETRLKGQRDIWT